MFYIHQSTCISPQESFDQVNLATLHLPTDNKLLVIEPGYENIPPGMLRRMGKAVRIGVGAGMRLIKNTDSVLNGIIIGTAIGGMEDCIKFLNQIVDYEEGQLTPGNFVQATPNAIAAQIGLLSKNKSYNITHVHRGLSFENAMLDVDMLLSEHPDHQYLLGGVDEISLYNYNIDRLAGWYKNEDINGKDIYQLNTAGSIAGEGATMFIVNKQKENSTAVVRAIGTLHTTTVEEVQRQLQKFMDKHLLPGEKIDLFLSGENGDNRDLPFYNACESLLDAGTSVARFKHMCGEFATASAVACWISTQIFKTQSIPSHMMKKAAEVQQYRRVLIYNNHKHIQHSFLLLTLPQQ